METPTIRVLKQEEENSLLAELTARMTQALNLNPTQSQSSSSKAAIQIGIKLDGTNYALWSY